MRNVLSTALSLLFPALVACAPPKGSASEPAASTQRISDAIGGRLYDKWYADSSYTGSFTADDKHTPEPDGAGGPNGDGTLNGPNGAPILNSGHDYRLKNLLGWDLRGTEGVYGPDYQNRANVVPVNLLSDTRSPEQLADWLGSGGDGVPAMGDVLEADQLRAIADFIVGVRSQRLPHPDQLWALSTEAPKNYTLLPGADVNAGAALFRERCGCHGADGTGFVMDEHYTVGSYARTKAYEVWFKIVNGQPGTDMGRSSQDAQEVLDLLAALCDRTAFPGADPEHDAPDGDPRCGEYLQ